MTSNELASTIELPAASGELADRLAQGGAVIWRESVAIATYDAAAPETYPMFLENRVYQGSSGKVYPLPFVEGISSEARMRHWDAIHLENEYIRLVVLPELGGRIHIGFDKTVGYDFFYRNNVIKPALVGLAGSWVSGGVEFNWPQHHRPATALPVEVEIEEAADGSVTVWCADHDPFARMRGLHGVRLRPGSSVIELVVRLHNRTSETQTFLWWANVAARVHDEYQSFFPTDVKYVADHARRAIVAFPEADRPYYGVDYPARVSTLDPNAARIDFYRNIPVPTSYMVLESKDNFFGGYDFAAEAGFVHWADRRIAPGKKQWTWGNSDFGRAWDALLTEQDGPYVELMAGVYTDNQPDFTFIRPGETKSFSQYWYPISGIGVAHQATLDVAAHLDVTPSAGGTQISLGLSATRGIEGARVRLLDGKDAHLYAEEVSIAPGQPVLRSIELDDEYVAADVTLVLEHNDTELLRWKAYADEEATEPLPATEPAEPDQIESMDELYLTGVHLAQYRHPTRSPLPYWLEALERDPEDSRSNLAVARYRYDHYDYAAALAHAERSLARSTARNTNPPSGEASYLLGLILRRMGANDRAYQSFGKATWDGAWAAPALLEMCRIDAQRGQTGSALALAEEAAAQDSADLRICAAQVVLLRRNGRSEDADVLLRRGLALDPLDQVLRLLAGQTTSTDGLVLRDIADDLFSLGEHHTAFEVLARAAAVPPTASGNANAVAHYMMAAQLFTHGRNRDARRALERAHQSDLRHAFPHGHSDFRALEAAIHHDPEDHRAHGLIGTLLYGAGAHQRALSHWEKALRHGSREAVVLRNAALGIFTLRGDGVAALKLYERALAESPGDARLLYESDQLLARLGTPASTRLARLDRYEAVLSKRDDLMVEHANLLVSVGRAEEALERITSRALQPWEGGEGQTIAVWERAILSACITALRQGRMERAEELARAAFTPPASLGEARHPDASTAAASLVLGDVLAACGKHEEAQEVWGTVRFDPAGPELFTSRPADVSTFFVGLSLARAGDTEGASAAWKCLDERIRGLTETTPKIDYFATSLPELLLFPTDLNESTQVEASQLRELAAIGRGQKPEPTNWWHLETTDPTSVERRSDDANQIKEML